MLNEQVRANGNNITRKRYQESRNHAVAAPALKNRKGGGGDFDVIFNLKVYPTKFMPLFDNFCPPCQKCNSG